MRSKTCPYYLGSFFRVILGDIDWGFRHFEDQEVSMSTGEGL
jgi:hypothetical protein